MSQDHAPTHDGRRHDSDHPDGHHHPGGGPEVSPIAARVAALEDLLVEKGYVTPAAIDAFITRYETEIGPLNGAKVVARAWSDPAYKARLLADGTAAIAELGFGGPEGGHLVVVENTDEVHHVVVCTLCSCYPWPVLGLPPDWYKSAPYRSRLVREPRTVLTEMGCLVPHDVRIEVWDSSAEARYLVLPQRPAGTDGLSEDELAGLVTRDAMIGVARP
jgi:nitrile hydratase